MKSMHVPVLLAFGFFVSVQSGIIATNEWIAEQDTEPAYEFQYAVHDHETGDIKDQFEHRRGDYVTGRYSLIDADGLRRIVEYNADPLLGFTAEVRRELPAEALH